MKDIDRRIFVLASIAAASSFGARPSLAAPTMTVHKDPTCGCCGAWVSHIEAAGYLAKVVETAAIDEFKARLGVPIALRSCHTAEIDGYVLEGHVPAAALARLLAERPLARGLAVPGMPVGSPGMEVAGAEPDTYDVALFGAGTTVRFMRFRGENPL